MDEALDPRAALSLPQIVVLIDHGDLRVRLRLEQILRVDPGFHRLRYHEGSCPRQVFGVVELRRA